jgi:hypothetical protein
VANGHAQRTSRLTDAAATLRRRWVEGGYFILAIEQKDWEIVQAVAELAPPPSPPEPQLYARTQRTPLLGASCEVRG